ncbi:acetyl-CoA synthetase-like protein [Thozetella sp. PMI_491]|nr:acetyl-CoA synthetase-like protein [Thozetella sp. PMI_491]
MASAQKLDFAWQGETFRSVLGLFNHHTSTAPAAPAIVTLHESLSYQELDALSTKLALRLTGMGAKEEMLIPLLFEKSAWTIVAMIGVLKSGAAFATLDPTHPLSRLNQLVQDLGSPIIVSSPKNAVLSASLCSNAVTVSRQHLEELPEPSSTITSNPRGDSAAYVIFTSGSTGTPKGAIIEHGQLATAAFHVGRAVGFEDKPRVLQFASYNYDVYILETMFTLSHGGCVCVPTDDERMSDIVGFMNATKVTVADLTPSVLAILPLHEARTLETIILGGEEPPIDLLGSCSRRFRVFSTYGPAECTVVATSFEVGTSDATMVPGYLGDAFGCHVWISDLQNPEQVAPVGVIGEIVVEGPSVGRGYLHNETKTKEHYGIVTRQSKDSNMPKSSRLYRTGDMGHYEADGSMIFDGRKDDQIKLNGRRVELGEIESSIRKIMTHGQVKVELIQLNSGAKKLAAFVLLGDSQEISDMLFANLSQESSHDFDEAVSNIQQELSDILPSYLVPTVYIPLTHMPFTPSKKINRRKLRDLASSLSPQALSSYKKNPDAPQIILTHNEQLLHQECARILGLDPITIGIRDNFVKLGGDSMAAMRLAASLRTQKLSSTVGDILDCPNLSATASRMHNIALEERRVIHPFDLIPHRQKSGIVSEAASRCEIATDMMEDIYPCSPTQVFYADMTEIYSNYQGPAGVNDQVIFSIHSNCDLERLKLAWRKVVSENPILRTRIIPVKDRLYQVVVKEEHDWQEVHDMDHYLSVDQTRPFEPRQPWSRFAISSSPDLSGRRRFVWTVSRALYDFWSFEILLKRLSELYANIEAPDITRPSPNRFVSNILARDLKKSHDFWKSHFHGISSKTLYPAGTRGRSKPNASAKHEFSLPSELNSASTPAVKLYGACAIIMSKYTGSPDVILQTVRTGRDVMIDGIEAMITPTIARIPLRIHVDLDERCSTFLHSLQLHLSRLVEYQYISWKDIASLSEDAAAACETAMLFTVRQEQLDISQTGNPIGFELEKFVKTNPWPLPLSIGWDIEGSCVKGSAKFDNTLFRQEGVDSLLRAVEVVYRSLSCINDDSWLRDLDTSVCCSTDIYTAPHKSAY